MRLLRNVTIIMFMGLVTLSAGCEYVTGAAGGSAITKSMVDWKANLEQAKLDLETQYADVLAELQDAPDPNAIAVAKEKLEFIRSQQFVNTGALFAVTRALEYPEGSESDNKDFWASTIIGGLALAYQTLTKRTLNTKYVSSKMGQARLKQEDPSAEAKLYSYVGWERLQRGL